MKLRRRDTFPVGYYTNLRPNGLRKAVPNLPVIGALAEHYTTLDRSSAPSPARPSPTASTSTPPRPTGTTTPSRSCKARPRLSQPMTRWLA